MKSSNDSITFLSRRSCRSNNHQQLRLRKVCLDPQQVQTKTRRSPELISLTNPKQINRTSESQTKNETKNQLFVKMNRFKHLISMYQDTVKSNANNQITSRSKNQDMKRKIINRKGSSRLSQLSDIFDIEHRSHSTSKNNKIYKYQKPQINRNRFYKINQRQLSCELPDTRQINKSSSKDLGRAYSRKLSEQPSKLERTNREEVYQDVSNDDIVQKIVNTQPNLQVNSDKTLARVLNEFGIKNQKQLNIFMQENEYFNNIYKSTSHSNNLVVATKTPATQYNKTFIPQQSVGNIQLQHQNYQCLPQLHLKKPSLKRIQLPNYANHTQKHIGSATTFIPVLQQYSPIQQISYKTSYQQAFSQVKQKQKQFDLQKPFVQTLIQGLQFQGGTQYNRSFKQPSDRHIRLYQKDKFNQLEYNKMKNGGSHNTFTTKGFQLLRTSYNQQFTPKQVSNKEMDIAYSSLIPPPKTQFIQQSSPSFMYQSIANKDFRQQNNSKSKRKTIPPWKYHLLSQLQALISMDKQKKQDKRTKHLS